MQRRDRAIEDALRVVLPAASDRDRNGIAIYIGLGLDTGFHAWGTLGLGTLDQLAVEMQRSYPTLTDAYSAARLLVDLRSLYFR